MRFQCNRIEKFIAETLQLLFLTTIVGCPFSGYQQQTTAMDTAAEAKDYLPSSSSSNTATRTLFFATGQTTTTKATLLTAHNSSLALLKASADEAAVALAASLPSSTNALTSSLPEDSSKQFTYSTVSPTLTTALSSQPSAASSYLSTTDDVAATAEDSISAAAAHHHQHHHYHHVLSSSLSLGYRAFTKSNIFPTSDVLSDSNEIDVDADTDVDVNDTEDDDVDSNITDDTITQDIVSHDTSKHFNTNSMDLSAFSLLSFNDSTASSLTLSSGSGSSSSNNGSNDSSGSHNNNNFNSNNNRPYKNLVNNSQSTTATFLQIKSQKIALKSTEAAAASATAGTQELSTTRVAATVGTHQHSNNNNNRHNSKSSRDKIESKYILPKPQKTDAPMLNYIFDTVSTANKHHHHDQRYGPHFEDVQRVGQPTNITVQAGGSVYLNCRISLLQDKTVSWVRRNAQGESALDLLTVGLHTYTGEKRYTMEFQYPNNWRLKITNVRKDDEAMYECQISTHPPRVIQINLHVNAPKVMIVDEFGVPLQEKYYEIDSTLQLSCIVRNVAMSTAVVFWKHGENVLNYDITRGGVSVKTELMEDGANSTLFIAKINKSDSGNYSCSISDTQECGIVVHILNGESFAELHHGIAAHLTRDTALVIKLVLIHFLIILSSCIRR